MRLEDVGLLGWLHTLACLAALVAGGWNTVMFDRGRWHRWRGHIYAGSMIVANLLVFVIYRFDMNYRGPPGPGRGHPGPDRRGHPLRPGAVLPPHPPRHLRL